MAAPTVRPVRTGFVRVKEAQRRRRPGGPLRTLTDSDWSEWLPIHAWLVEHDGGLLLVDTGETARAATEPGYFPRWHPYYRLAVDFDVRPEDELGPQLRRLGVDPAEVGTVVLTHLHTDHAGGLAHVPHAHVWVDADEYALAKGFAGRLRGYPSNRWPASFAPTFLAWRDEPVGPFERSAPLTPDGSVVAIPTPGHTPHHLSVLVRGGDAGYLLAGDVSDDEQIAIDGVPDGVAPDAAVARETLRKVQALAATEPFVYLPAHDPDSEARLAERRLFGER
jgi:glyoxylase-like metal-dependent hydrolase (beta-lactamase superfamily II)